MRAWRRLVYTLVTKAIAERRAHDAGILAANLFSSDGKLCVTVTALTGDCAELVSVTAPRVGTIAVLARNGLRLVGTIAAVEGQQVTVRLDDALEEWRTAWFVGAARDAGAPVLAQAA